jgi:hypothetical protein
MKDKRFTAFQMRHADVPYGVCRRAGYSQEELELQGYPVQAFLEKYFGCFYGANYVAPS